MKIRLNIDEIKAIVVSYLQGSMPSVNEKCVTMDSEGISIETNLSDALGINVETRKRRTRRTAEEVKEEPEESVSTDEPEPEPEVKEDNTVTGILEGNRDPKGLFD
jgi:hypothetical protein